MKTALENAKSEGVTGVFSMGLSNYSQKIFRRMGFLERNSLEYSQYTQVEIRDRARLSDIKIMSQTYNFSNS